MLQRYIIFRCAPLRNWDRLGITFYWVGHFFVMGVDETICLVCGGSTFVGETISCETCLHWWVNFWYFTIKTNFELTFQGITLTALVWLTTMIASSKRMSPTFVQGFLLKKLIVNFHIWCFPNENYIFQLQRARTKSKESEKATATVATSTTTAGSKQSNPRWNVHKYWEISSTFVLIFAQSSGSSQVDHQSLPLPGFCWKQVKAEQEKSWERSSSKKYQCGVKGRCFAFSVHKCENMSNINGQLFQGW